MRALEARLEAAHAARHRSTVIIAGDPPGTIDAAKRVLRAAHCDGAVWLSDRPDLPQALPLRAATSFLGQDLPALVYDACSGFDPDGFGVVTGAIRGGGLLVLLTPRFTDWPHRLDPQAERIAVWPYRAEQISGRFITRVARVLDEDTEALQIELSSEPDTEAGEMPSPLAGERGQRARPVPGPDPATPATTDQARAVRAILDTARGRGRRPLVLRAHRGRGKSAALGIAAARLIADGLGPILVTAPARSSVDALFKHATAALAASAPDAEIGRTLQFIAPADLLATRPEARLLLIDEAAGIPTHMLEQLLGRYRRIVFATTVHGYEGTGRGFDVRFRQTLNSQTPDWRALTLSDPIRWGPDDPLERVVFRALLLDTQPAPDDIAGGASLSSCVIERFDQDALLRDERLLRELFGLLALSHYQTKPLDLRMLLDGPNLRILVARSSGHILGALLAAEEGGLHDQSLMSAIFLGHRRPRGHLLPQTLSAHGGLRSAPAWRYLRVIRIAVHPAAQDRGLGRSLLSTLHAEALALGVQLTGASFAATRDLLHFWGRCDYRPVQVGTSRNAASGEHAVVVLRATDRRAADFVSRAQDRFKGRLSTLLAGPLRHLSPELVVTLLSQLPPSLADRTSAFDDDAWAELASFAHGHRSLDATLPLLQRLTLEYLGQALASDTMSHEDAKALVITALQLRPLGEASAELGRDGRKDSLRRHRAAAGALLLAARVG